MGVQMVRDFRPWQVLGYFKDFEMERHGGDLNKGVT